MPTGKKCATSICKGICAFAGKVYQEEKSPVVHGPVIIENRTEDVDLILWEGRNYLSARDVGELFGYEVSFQVVPRFSRKRNKVHESHFGGEIRRSGFFL